MGKLYETCLATSRCLNSKTQITTRSPQGFQPLKEREQTSSFRNLIACSWRCAVIAPRLLKSASSHRHGRFLDCKALEVSIL
jgi:hypothetical protein